MNNTFNFNRFGKVISADGRKYYRNFGITVAILSSLTLVLWLLTLVFSFTMPTFVRWGMIYLAVVLACIMVPAKAFGDINLKREGIRFAMMPASNLEKFLSYAFFCLLTPVVVFLLSWGLDSLLTALPFGGFTHYIKSFGLMESVQNFAMEMGELTEADMVGDDYEAFQSFSGKFDSSYLFSHIVRIIFTVGIFMFGNLLFKTHKTAKTLACMIGISYVITMLMQSFFLSRGIYPWQHEVNTASMDLESLTNYTSRAMLLGNIFRSLLAVALYVGLFFKLKTQKY